MENEDFNQETEQSVESEVGGDTHKMHFIILAIAGVVIVALIIGAALYVVGTKNVDEVSTESDTEEASVSTTTEDATIESVVEEAASSVSDLNPTANTNPFKDTYKNPFE